ncbi:MAG: histidine kinase dimerization/phosphoacceptor domain -containing protein [Balneolaceae bacterium]
MKDVLNYLVLDAKKENFELIKQNLQLKDNDKIFQAVDTADLLKKIKKTECNIIISDLSTVEATDLELFRELKEAYSLLPYIFLNYSHNPSLNRNLDGLEAYIIPKHQLEGLSHAVEFIKTFSRNKQMVSSLKKERDYLKKERLSMEAEIDHRVKNNLAAISGMMQLQTYQVEDPELKEKLNVHVDRIKTMSEIHEGLYRSGSFSKINIAKHVLKFISRVVDSVETTAKIDLDTKIEPVNLQISQAVPFFLILNEIITNILKHSFTGRITGRIEIIISEDEEQLSCSIIDNGNMGPDTLKDFEKKGIGLLLAKIQAQQLDGSQDFFSNPYGNIYSLKFPIKKIQIVSFFKNH